MRVRFLIFLAMVLTLCLFFTSSCSQNADEEPQKKDDSMVVTLLVDHDDMFGFDLDEQAGRVFLSDSRGPVGSPVEIVVLIDDIDRFDENDIDLSIVLTNPDSIKLDSFELIETFDDERAEYKIVVPQVITIPTLLDFDVTLGVTNDETGDYFEATTFFQYFVNTGTPAT